MLRDDMKITKEMLNEVMTYSPGYEDWIGTKKQKGMMEKTLKGRTKKFKCLIDVQIGDKWWTKFTLSAAGGFKARSDLKRERRADRKHKQLINNQKQAINAMSKKDSWSWQPTNPDIPGLKRKRKNGGDKGSNRAKRVKLSKKANDEFYSSREWRSLRVRVLEKYQCKCMMCGRSPRIHGIIIHVDHIKPRSKYPDLSLTFENLQLLCEDCNLGKSNKYETDWRPDEMAIVHEAIKRI